MTRKTEEQQQTSPTDAVELDEGQLEHARGGLLAAQTVAQKVVDARTIKWADGSVRPISKAGDGSV